MGGSKGFWNEEGGGGGAGQAAMGRNVKGVSLLELSKFVMQTVPVSWSKLTINCDLIVSRTKSFQRRSPFFNVHLI